LIISILMIFLILLFHLRNISLALLVLSSAALSVVGAAAGMLIMHVEFSLTSILGIVSLIGIIVRNGIIMLDYAEELRRHKKMTVLEAAFEAGKRRMRPIFLTSTAASMGVIPMIISRSAMWSPMGTVIFFGTLTSMVLLVLILPVAYWYSYRNSAGKKETITIAEVVNRKKIKPAVLLVLIILATGSALTAQTNYSLEQCKEQAIRNNTLIKNKQLDIQSSQELKKAAFTKYFPQIDATGMAFRFGKPVVDMNIPGGNLPVYNGNPATLPAATQFAYFPGADISMFEKGTVGMVTAVQPLFAGTRIITGNKLAKLGTEVSTLQLTSAEDQVAVETEKQYWQIVELGEKVKTLAGYLQMVDTLHKEVSDALQAGLITRNDLLKVELKQNELKMNLLKLKNGLNLAKMALCQYIGIIYSEELNFTDGLGDAREPQFFYTDHEQALENRAEFQLLKKSAEAEKYQTRMRRGEYLPQLGIGAGGLYLDVMDGKSTTTGMVFGTLKIPVSGWWEASYKMKERSFKEQQNRNMVADHTEKLLLQMQQSRNTLEEAYQQVKLAEISVSQSEENLKVSRDHFSAGLISVSDMLEAQAMVQASKDNLIAARCGYRLAVTTYLQVTGKYQVNP